MSNIRVFVCFYYYNFWIWPESQFSIYSTIGSWVGPNGCDQPRLGPSPTSPSMDPPALYELMLLLRGTFAVWKAYFWCWALAHQRDVKGSITFLSEWWVQLHTGALYEEALANSLFRGLVWRALLSLKDSLQKVVVFTVGVFVKICRSAMCSVAWYISLWVFYWGKSRRKMFSYFI